MIGSPDPGSVDIHTFDAMFDKGHRDCVGGPVQVTVCLDTAATLCMLLTEQARCMEYVDPYLATYAKALALDILAQVEAAGALARL